ncbi:hypothetical protein VQL36_09325 [Chengkuizengella sp. SCS-71B]|uniref:hypothetical protein n=1 Tax=Chengkuizengella sp. SCS-71B TaxID=3115290 RepID=UPI0032C22710
MSFHNKVEVKQFEVDIPENSRNTGKVISMTPNIPTKVAEITFDCLKPGDCVWLNSIFHVDKSGSGVVRVNHSILKKNDEIYSAATEVDDFQDDLGQIFSQQTVDVITTLEKDVTYTVVCFADQQDAFLQGPITFTGTRFVEGKKSFKRISNGLLKNVLEFQFSRPPINSNTDEGPISMTPNIPTKVAEITFNCLKPGDCVWLNSIFHVNNDTGLTVTVNHRILKNNNPIYTASTNIEDGGEDNQGQIFPQQFVDVITTLEKDVTYTVVCDTDMPMVNLSGPIILTGTRLVEDRTQFEFNPRPPVNSNTFKTPISTDDLIPTEVATITFDCLKPGDRIWLNSIFHVDNNTTTSSVVTVNHRILKNNDPNPIYNASTEIDFPTRDGQGQIFSQQFVDVITTLEKDVTYTVVCDTDTLLVNLSGPIIFTGTRLVKDK